MAAKEFPSNTKGMSISALIVVDLQNDFLPGGAISSLDKNIVSVIGDLLNSRKFNLAVASQDWHPQEHISFAATHNKQPGQSVTVDGFTYQLFVKHCLQHSQGAELPDQLKRHDFDKIVRKGTDPEDECFSAFCSMRKRKDTGLERFLKDHYVHQVYVTGMTLEQCVKETVQDALQAGFETFIIVDACAPVDPGAENPTLQHLQGLGAQLIRADQVPISHVEGCRP